MVRRSGGAHGQEARPVWLSTRAYAGSASSVFGVSFVAIRVRHHGISNLGMWCPGADLMHNAYKKKRSASGSRKDTIFVYIAFSWLVPWPT